MKNPHINIAYFGCRVYTNKPNVNANNPLTKLKLSFVFTETQQPIKFINFSLVVR